MASKAGATADCFTMRRELRPCERVKKSRRRSQPGGGLLLLICGFLMLRRQTN